MHCKIFTRIPALCLLDTISIPPNCNNQTCFYISSSVPGGVKLLLGENPSNTNLKNVLGTWAFKFSIVLFHSKYRLLMAVPL